jgi:site-specific DNA recombinase
MDTKKPVGIWIRVSTEDQAKGESPEHHERRARLYAESKDWEVREVYHLEAVSGKLVMEHTEAKRMLKDIRDGHITGLIFSKLARLARNTKELLEFAEIFNKENADLISLHESIDTSTPAGRLFYTIIAAMAQWEREEIVSRITASIPIRAQMGKSLGGLAPFGYKYVDKVLVIDENEAPVRKLVYELFLKLKRKKTVANELNKMGYRTRNGVEFTDSTVFGLLRDSTPKGIRRINYNNHTPDGKRTFKPESEWMYVPCPAIVEEELWNECNRIMDEQREKNQRPGPKSVHLLSGFVHCTCGKKMYVYHRNLKFTCKQCKTGILVSDIDEIFHGQLKSFLLNDTDIVDYEKKQDRDIQEKEQLLKVLAEEAAKNRRKMKDLVDMRLGGELSKENFVLHHKPLEERMGQLDAQIPELQASVDFLKIQYLSSDTVLQGAKDLYQQWPVLPFEDKRSIVEIITGKIIVGTEDIHMTLAYLPSVSGNAGKSQSNL